MKQIEPKHALLRSAYIARLHATRTNDSIGWGLIAAAWLHIAGAVVLMNIRISAIDMFKEYQAEEPLLVVQRLLQTGLEPGGFIELTRRAENPPDPTTPQQEPDEEQLEALTRPVPREDLSPESDKPIDDTEDRALEFVRIDELGAAPLDPSAARIAKHDSRAREQRRTPILAQEVGQLAPHYDELAARRDDGQAGLESQEQFEEAMMGVLKSERAGERRVRTGRDGTAVGAPVTGSTPGSPGDAAGRVGRSGGVRADRQLESHGGSAPGESVAPAAGGYPIDANNTHMARRVAPATWNPSVYRYQSSQQRGNAIVSPHQPSSPRVDDQPSPVPRVDIGQARGPRQDGEAPAAGGTTRSERIDTPVTEPSRKEFTVEVRALGPEELDPVAHLQEDLGWEGVVPTPRPVRQGTIGLVGSDGSRSSSPQTVLPEDYPLASDVAVSALGTELGAYLHEVDKRISRAWHEVDLPMEDRALGIQGRVTLTIQVRSTGKVLRLEVTASSGNARLDEMARQAIPRRFKAFPRTLEFEGISHRVTLRYSNPLILPGVD
jgi:TonB family protein